MDRLEHFLCYYRKIGIEHFIIIDNKSEDNTVDRLTELTDVSLFKADGNYRDSRFGVDWVNYIASKYCIGKWVLHVDADEYFVFPEIDSMTIQELSSELASCGRNSMQCLMLDMYSQKVTSENVVSKGQDPRAVCSFFDGSGYLIKYDRITNTKWIKGGVRGRIFFPEIEKGPALNKTPLVYWKRHYAFLKSTHQLWPYFLNDWGDDSNEVPRSALLHFKFLSDFSYKVQEELNRKQHTHEYNSYSSSGDCSTEISFYENAISVEYLSWRSLSEIKVSFRN